MAGREWLIFDLQKQVFACVVRGWLDQKSADHYYDRLLKEVKWERTPVNMFGKLTLQARLTYPCGDANLVKAGRTMNYTGKKFPLHDWPCGIEKLRDRTSQETQLLFDSSLLNYYPLPGEFGIESSHLSWHYDKNLTNSYRAVASVSLGGTRQFEFRKRDDHQVVSSFEFRHGDGLLFWGEQFQELFEHRVVALTKRENRSDWLKSRISITFRNLYNGK